MADWVNTYREEQIPGANQAGVITSHTPGKMIAKAITELQSLSVNEVAPLELSGVITGSADITDNVLTISLDVPEPEIPEIPDPLPSGGEREMVLTRTASSSDELGATWDYVKPIIKITAEFNSGSGELKIFGDIKTADAADPVEFETQTTIPVISGITKTFQVVTGVEYDSSSRSFRRRVGSITISNGIITASSDGSWQNFLTLSEFGC